jgi:Uma2 family endonuclease
MSSAHQFKPISVDDYLEGELLAKNKHEYVDGRVYAMSGAKNVHNRIASRVLGSLYQQLGSSRCEAFNSDTKVRIRTEQRTYFYYPDAVVVCDSNPDDDTFQDQPVVIVEVISDSTRRIDEGEKRVNYLSVPSLDAYILLEQDRRTARVFQRTANQFLESIYTDPDSVVPIPAINAQLYFSEVYAGIEFEANAAQH